MRDPVKHPDPNDDPWVETQLIIRADNCLNSSYVFLFVFQGAIILDTVFNYDPNANSQDIPSQWKTGIPGNVKKIKYNNQKGDFLALIGRNNPEEIRMTKKIQKWASTLGIIHILRFEAFWTPSPLFLVLKIRIFSFSNPSPLYKCLRNTWMVP